MASIRLKFSPEEETVKALRREIENELKKTVRNNFGDFRVVVSEAVNEAIEEERERFIPTDREAAELGIGEGGQLNRDKINNTYKQLRTDSGAGISRFSVQKQRTGAANNLIGNITVNIDEEAFYATDMARQAIKDGEIPWMRWLLNGSETIAGYVFVSRGAGGGGRIARLSRTGRGIMIPFPASRWILASANFGAFQFLEQTIQEKVIDAILARVGDVF